MEEVKELYELVTVACRARLLFHTEEEYLDLLGVSFETIRKNSDSLSEVRGYYRTLDEKSRKESNLSLKELVGRYTDASEFYQSIDWGRLKQKGSRKLFCRLLFRLYATAGRELSVDEIMKFKSNEEDADRLLKLVFPEGLSGHPQTDILFLLLFAYDILRPWSGGASRWHDRKDKDTLTKIDKMRQLVAQLKKDMPQLGSCDTSSLFEPILRFLGEDTEEDKSKVFHNIILNLLEEDGEDAEELECYLSIMTPVVFMKFLRIIIMGYHSLIIPNKMIERIPQPRRLYMRGIWIDDADEGRTRFWIFPEESLSAFCYCQVGEEWELRPYSFIVHEIDDAEYIEVFTLITPKGNRPFLFSWESPILKEEMAQGGMLTKFDKRLGEITSVSLKDVFGNFPGWLDWREWDRLSADDPRYSRFIKLLQRMYTPGLESNPGWLRDVVPDGVNAFVGRDRKYIYIYDWRPRRCMMKIEKGERFHYIWDCGDIDINTPLFELNVSEEHPLYAIPLTTERRRDIDKETENFMELLVASAEINEAVIIHPEGSDYPRLLLPQYERGVNLNMEMLEKLGVRRFTTFPPR
ncbi:MAG: hypothetical protein HDS14_01750 [Bacteroides sp.]|nr:hypothetical protein [Bacteroides sp.]